MNIKSLYNAILMFFMVFGATPLWAQPQTMDGQTQAALFIRLWSDTCVKHFTNPTGLKETAKIFRFLENPDYALNLLAGQKGTVWDVSLGPLIQTSVVLLDSGVCKTLVRKVDVEPVVMGFEKVLQGINTPGVEVRKSFDRLVQESGIEFRQIGYFVGGEGRAQGWSFVATVSSSEKAEIQATISIFRSERPKL